MNNHISFGLFDTKSETEISYRQLPHWFQSGVATFITFRTADSLPKEVLLQWQEELRCWLKSRSVKIMPDGPLPDASHLPESLRSEFLTQRNRIWHWKLDECHGECLLQRRELAQIVLDALRFFDGDRYDLDCAIIMPNHVHLIAQFRRSTTLRKQCNSWLHYSARQINKSLGRPGTFWQSEPFDHLIRTEDQFHYIRQYIANNGSKAGLSPDRYLYWSRSPYDLP